MVLDLADIFGCYVGWHIPRAQVCWITMSAVLTGARRKKKKRSALCFVLDEYVAVPPRCSAPVLSQLTGTELNVFIPCSVIKFERCTTSFAP